MSILYPVKHKYLQKSVCYEIDQKTVNRLMDKKMSESAYMRHTCPDLKNYASHMFSPNVDVTRSKRGFGRWAIPMLRRQIHNSDVLVVAQAVNTILDMVYNPVHAYEAISLGVVDRLADMMLHEKEFIREKICMIFFVLASEELGRRVIIRRYEILNNLFRLCEDEVEEVQRAAQRVVEMLSRNIIGSVGLNMADCLALTLRLIGGAPGTAVDDILLLNLNTLEQLLENDCKVQALSFGAMDILTRKLEHRKEDIVAAALSCIAIICKEPEGRLEASEKSVHKQLCAKLHHESVSVQTKAAAAFTFVTIDSRTRLKACSPCVLDRLLQLMENFHSVELQLMATKALTNLAEVPTGREYLSKKQTLKRIQDIYVGQDAEVEKHKQILLNVIRWKP